jgi:exopolysaccharide production protein ExoQ
MIKKIVKISLKPIVYSILFFLTIRRIIIGGPISLQEQTLEKTAPEILLWVLLLLLFLWMIVTNSKTGNIFHIWQQNWLLFVFILFSWSSLIWSLNINATFYKGIVILGCTFIAAFTGIEYIRDYFIRGFWWLSTIIVMLTLAVALLFPAIGTHIGFPYYGAWRGIFWSKNYMGPIMAFGNLVFLFSIYFSRKKWFALLGNIILYVLTAVLVILSKCATAVILLFVLNSCFLLAIAWVSWNKYLRKVHYIMLAVLFFVSLTIMLLNINSVLGLFGRDSTLTGRFPLWSYLIQNGWENHLLVGSGFGATWESNNFRFIAQGNVGWSLVPLVSDSGYIDIFLHLGLIGIILLISIIFLCIYRVVRNALKERTVLSFFPILIMVFAIVVNLSLSFFLELESLIWFLVVFALFASSHFYTGDKLNKLLPTN